MAFDKQAYDKEYVRNNYDVIRATVPKGRGADIKKVAAQHGISVSQLIVRALEQAYHIDLSKD